MAEGIPDPVLAANMELHLLMMFHLSVRPVDKNRVKELITTLQEAGDVIDEGEMAFLQELGQE